MSDNSYSSAKKEALDAIKMLNSRSKKCSNQTKLTAVNVAHPPKEELKLANYELDKLKALSGTENLTTIKLVGDTIPERWCPELGSKVKVEDLPSIPGWKILNIDGGSP